jgi:hypothetical protein
MSSAIAAVEAETNMAAAKMSFFIMWVPSMMRRVSKG